MTASEKTKKKPLLIVMITTIVAIVAGGSTLIGFYDRVKPNIQVSGEWEMTFNVKETNYKSYLNDCYVYELYVTQDKDCIKGSGEQELYNGKIARSHFKIELKDGRIEGHDLKIPYTIFGHREAAGILILKVDDNNHKHLTGTFSGGAANTSGSVNIFIK